MIAMQYGSGSAAGKAVGLRMDLLWENDDLSSNFAAQTVQVDLSSYSHYLVVPIFSKANQNTSPGVLNVAEDGVVCGLVVGSGTNNNVGSRTCYYDSSVPGIVFAGGNYGGSSHNDYCIPKAIYGVKTGSGSSSGGGGGGGGGSGVASVNGMTGIVVLGAADVGAVPSGQGVPSGGTTGQVLAKASGTDYDLTWSNGGGGGGPSPYTSNPAALGTASAGSSADYSRGDHVHPMPSASDVGALPSTTPYVSSFNGNTGAVTYTAPVTSVNNQTGDVSLAIPSSAADVGAIAAPASPTVGDFLVYTNNGWAAMSLSTWQGGSY